MIELYQLRLEHCLVDDEGGHHQLEEPLVVGMATDMRYHQASFCINSMLDRMREEVLKRSIGNESNNNNMHHFSPSGGKTGS